MTVLRASHRDACTPDPQLGGSRAGVARNGYQAVTISGLSFADQYQLFSQLLHTGGVNDEELTNIFLR